MRFEAVIQGAKMNHFVARMLALYGVKKFIGKEKGKKT